MTKLILECGLLLAMASTITVWARQSPTAPPRPSAEAVERGRAQFAQSCAFCHGPNANGGTHGPSLIRSAVVRHDENGNLIGAVIREGRREQGMPPMVLSESQVSDIVAFLRSRLAVADVRSANRPVMGSADKLRIGNAEAGKAFFDGAGGCSSCHSPDKDLAGIGRKYSLVDLQARLLYPSRQRRKATIIEAGGKQHTGELLLLTQYDVAIQDGAGWYRSWPVSEVKVDVEDRLAAHRALLDKYTDADMHNMLAYLETLR